MTDRLNARRTPDPGTENCQFRYSDICVNCGKPIVAELTGVLVTGDLYDWRHKSPWSPYCSGRAGRRDPQAIPAAEAEAECTVHRKVTRWHHCEAGGTVVFREPGHALQHYQAALMLATEAGLPVIQQAIDRVSGTMR